MRHLAPLLPAALLVPAALLAPAATDERPLARFEALLAEGRHEEARQGLEPLVAAAPDDALLRCLLAHALVGLCDAAAALPQADAALRLAPTWASPWYQRGRALLLQHEFGAADTAFTHARARAPEWEPGWRDHFHALAALGSGDEARAIDLFSRSPEARAPGGPAFLFERMAALWPIVPEPEPARGWYRRAALEWFGPAAGATPAQAERRRPFDLAPPVRGEWRVMQGHFGDESHFGIAGAWSLDLMQVEAGRLARSEQDDRAEAFFTLGAEVFAPAGGRVVRVVADQRDHAARAGDRAPLLAADVARASLGNHVVLELAPDAFLLLAHLRHGSITAVAGDRVVRGQRLGAVGMTGVTWAPHLHLAVWSQLAPVASRPLRFIDARCRDAKGRLRPPAPFAPEPGESVLAR
ncbi:MAG: M23 family metallopeptidase [Planctomycetes bacterium]|nr:M23 family metallopeptidase [Planctomycetota bacterium]